MSKVFNNSFVHILLVVALGSLVYSETLGGPFLFDDSAMIVKNPIIKDMDYVLHPFSAIGQKDFGIFWRRYIGFSSFALNYSAHGLSVGGYHVVNIALHILNAILVYAFLRVLALTPLFRIGWYSDSVRPLALLASLIFVAHPINTEAVNYIYQRVTLLSFFFYMCSLIMYLKMRLSDVLWQRRALYLLCLSAGVLAVKSKENALVLILAAGLCEFLFFDGQFKRRLLYVLGLLIPVGVYLLSLLDSGMTPVSVLFGASGDAEMADNSTFDADYLNPGGRRFVYLLTEIRVITTYLRLLMFPVKQNFLYDYPAVTSLFSLPLILSFSLILSLLAVAVYAGYRFRRGGGVFYGLVAFSVLWFFIGLLVESSIIPLPLFITEYRLYLPSVGFIVLFSASLVWLLGQISDDLLRSLVICVPVMLVLVLSVAGYQRNKVWASATSLWEDVIQKSPSSVRAHNNLGVAYSKEGRMVDAIKHYRRTLELEGVPIGAWREAITITANKSKSNKKRLAGVFANLGEAYKALNQFVESINNYEIAIAMDPFEPNYRYNVGNTYMKTGQTKRAVTHYEKALEIIDDPDIHNNLSIAYRSLGNERKASEHFEKAQSGY